MTSPTAVRLAARLARREVRRRPWRTVLVALLVALPVAGMTMAVGFVRTDRVTPEDEWRASWGGTTDLAFSSQEMFGYEGDGFGPARDVVGALTALPPGSRVSSWHHTDAIVRTVGGERATVDVRDLPLTHGIGKETFQVLGGRAPVQPNEVFLSRTLADELGVAVGDTIDLERPYRAWWRVVGVGERRAYWDSYTAVLAPGTPFPWGTAPGGAEPSIHAVDLPDGTTKQQVLALASVIGPSSLAPHLQPRTPDADSKNAEVAWSWVIGAIVLTVVGIVIASAFAAGARRQLTTLGQLAANGAGPSVLRGVLFLQGTWTGAIGTVLGLALGGAGLVALAPHADGLLGRDVDPWQVRVTDLVPIVGLGILAATVAALVPARTTVRVPVLAALAGRRPLSRVPRWVTGMGAVTAFGGLGLLGLAVLGGREADHDAQLWALTAILGGMGVLLGACAMTPGYTSVLEPLAARVSGSWRLAARSLARQRTRTSAVVAGVCAASALAVGASALILTSEAEASPYQDSMRPDEVYVTAEMMTRTGPDEDPYFSTEAIPPPRELVDSLRGALPGAEVLELSAVQPAGGLRWQVEHPQAEPDGDGDEGFQVTADHKEGSAAALFDATAARVYRLSSKHRAILEKEDVLLLGISDADGELSFRQEPTFGPGGVPRPVKPGGPGPVFVSPGAALVSPVRPTAPTGSQPPPTRHQVTIVDAEEYAVGSTLPRLLVMPSAVERLGFVPRPGLTVLRTPKPLTSAQATAVSDLLQDYRLDTTPDAAFSGRGFGAPDTPILNVSADVLYPPDGIDPLLLEAILAAAALLFSLFVVAVSLALAAAETRDERDVLTVVGASPRTMWGTSGRKAVLLTSLGGLLAIPVGFLPVVVLNLARNPTPPTVFPWRVTLLLLLAVPVIAGLATTAAGAAAARVRPVRISTMAFD
jgi:putative ABC transport system permease protein